MRSRFRKPWWKKQARDPLIDVYAPKYIRMWLAFEDGYVNSVAEDSVGELPEWYDRDVTELGWESILGSLGCGGWEWAGDLNWLVAYGIAPGQSFLVHLDEPRWYRCGEYGSESDCEYDWELLRVQPLSPAIVRARWERAVRGERAARAYSRKRMAELECLRRTDVKSMYVKCDVYFASGQSTYDDMTMPSGIRYTLASRASLPKERGTVAYLLSGEDDEGDHDKAFERLVERAMKELPGLPEEKIRCMEKRSW